MSSAPARRTDLAIAAVVAAVPALLLAYDWRYHEFWRDETQAFTLARDLPLDMFYGGLRMQGIPPLYFLLLKLTSQILASPIPLLVLGAVGNGALLFGTYKLLYSVSGARRASLLTTLCFSLTYVYAYELGVVVRQYSLGLGLALTSLAYLREAVRSGGARDVWLGAATGGLAALTSAHASCTAGGVMLAFGLTMLARRRGLRLGWPIFLALPCFALTLQMATPYPGRIPSCNADASHDWRYLLRLGLHLAPASAMPSDWWRTDLLPSTVRWQGQARYVALVSLVAAFAAAFAARCGSTLRRRPGLELFPVAAIALSWPPLVEIVGNHYYGYYRHHLHVALPLIVLLAGWCIDSSCEDRSVRWLRRAALVAMGPWFLFHQLVLGESLWLDMRYAFSDTKGHAQGLPLGAHLVSSSDETTVGMVAWRPDLSLRSATSHGRHFRYQICDPAWFDHVGADPLVAEECRAAPDRTFTTFPMRCASQVADSLGGLPDRPTNRESFGLWRVDCACLAR
jgi:hypothetical protein